MRRASPADRVEARKRFGEAGYPDRGVDSLADRDDRCDVTVKPIILRILGLCAILCGGVSGGPVDLVGKSGVWFRSDEGIEAVENVLSWQSDHGSWPKNLDTSAKRFTGDRSKLQGTFDNAATTGEIRFLAKAFEETKNDRCRVAVLRGIDHILNAQYANGGWPQYFPPKGYASHITFNDGSMERLLVLLRDVAESKDLRFVDAKRRAMAGHAVEKGIDCIVSCQVKVRGRRTVWCAQHDEKSLKPASARAYELATLSGSESAGLLCFLMSIERPSRDVVRAVRDGVAWFEDSAIHDIRVVKADGDRKVVPDRGAPDVWARFYEIETNRPIFCGRDGKKKYTLAEIERERRFGYAWYGNWGEKVAKAHANWKYR